MSDMRFSSPTTVEHAVDLLKEDSTARVFAGGTDLLVQLQSGLRSIDHAVDLKRISELNEVIQSPDGSWRLGSAVCSAALNENKILKAQWPGVLEAADLIGSMQVQGRATLAGNLCNASPAADSVPALVAASATVTIAGPNGRRSVPAEAIPLAPGKTSLEQGEIIVSVDLPPKSARSGEAYCRFIPRSEMDIAVAGAGVFLTLDENGTCTYARASLGAVAPTVLCFDGSDDGILIGTRVDIEALEHATSILRSACAPIDDKRGTAEYRIEIAGVLFKQAAEKALQRAVG